jgi:hypothetical protein
MANIITLDSPNPADIIGQFADRYSRSQAQRNAMDVERKRIGIEQQRADTEGEVSRGTLGLAKSQQEQQAEIKMVADWASKAIEPFNDGTPEGRATAQKNLQAFMAQHPNVDVMGIAQRLAGQPTMADRTRANVGKFAETQSGIAASGSPDVQARAFTQEKDLGRAMSPQQFADQAQRQPEAAAPPKGTPASAYTESLRRDAGAMPTAAQDLAAKTQITTTGMQEAGALKRAGIAAAASRSAQSGSQGEAIAAAIIKGEQPPVVQSRTLEGPVRAALAAQGYDLTKATQDWKATERYLSTLNGPGQVRLRQAVDFAYESLGLVKDLAEQWKGGRFPLLNKVSLEAAKQGAMGPDAQAIATKLDSQIVEMQSELSVVYRGGNSPTDESLKQAAKVLQSNWSLPTLLANVDLLEKNLAIRRNSIVTAGVAANVGNTYNPNVTLPKHGEGPSAAPAGGVVGTYVPGKGLVRH